MNKLIPMILLLVALIAGGIGWLSLRSKDTPTMKTEVQALPLPNGHVSQPEAISISDATSYSSQFKGTASKVQSLERHVQSTDERIKDEVKQALQDALPQIERKIREDLHKKEVARTKPQNTTELPPFQTNRVVETTPTSVPAPAHALPAVERPLQPRSTRLLDIANAGVPNGFGFDELNASSLKLPGKAPGDFSLPIAPTSAGSSFGNFSSANNVRPGFVKISAWQPNVGVSTPGAKPNAAFPESGTTPTAKPTTQKKGDQKENNLLPVYTIENTATLFSNTTMTAFMGVVPNRNNAVKNLMRFKLITGADNIASNGLYLPDVKNIIWTGYVIGNREMECVQATVDTVTFTFQDKTIRTVTKKKSGGGGQLSEGLGYLSDRWGKPCIKGRLISNASQYLSDRMKAAGAAAAASAAAATQTTTLHDDTNGVSRTAVTGDRSDYIAGQMTTATLNELTLYMRDRMDQAIDIVYLDAGRDVVLHVEEEIAIDYDRAGRKLSHVAMAPGATPMSMRRVRLD